MWKIFSAAVICSIPWSICFSSDFDSGDSREAEPLAPVVVIAQKVLQDERDVPMSMAVIKGDKFDSARIDTADDLSRYAANVDFADKLLYIRGIGSGGLIGFEPSVGIFTDGIYFGRATAALAPLLDIDHAELIRGPQATLLGKNTIAGALNLITNQPADEFEGNLQGLYGNLNERGFKGAASIPINDDWAARIAFVNDQREGYMYNSTLNSNVDSRTIRGGRVKVAWRPASDFGAWISAESGFLREKGFANQLTAATDASLTLFRLYDPATETNVRDDHTALDTLEYGVRNATSITVGGEFRTNAFTITSLSNIAQSTTQTNSDGDYSPVPLITQNDLEGYHQWSQELRLTAHTTSIDYILGVYFLHSTLDVSNVITALPKGTISLATQIANTPAALAQLLSLIQIPELVGDQSIKSFHQKSGSISLFSQSTWHMGDNWALTGGLRWTLEDKSVHASNHFQKSGLLFTQLLGEEQYDAQLSRRENNVTPRVSLQYGWDKNTDMYLSYANGFKGGGFNDFAPSRATLEFAPERSTTWEAGIKTLIVSNKLSLDLTVFSTDYRNLQVNSYDGTKFYIANAARAAISGVEMESRWRLTRGWNSTLSLGYLNAHYRSYPNAPAQKSSSDVAGTRSQTQDLSGQPLVYAPRESGAMGISYQSLPIGPGLVWQIGTDALFRSKTFFNLDDNAIDSQRAYWMLNASLNIRSEKTGLSLNLSGKNLANKRVQSFGQDVALFSGNHVGYFEVGRLWAASLEYEW